MTLIGQAVSVEKKFKERGQRRTDNGACLYYKLTNGSGELKKLYKQIIDNIAQADLKKKQ